MALIMITVLLFVLVAESRALVVPSATVLSAPLTRWTVLDRFGSFEMLVDEQRILC